MTLTYLVDTDWVVHYLNGHPEIVARLDVLKHQGLGLSTVALGELYEGVFYSRDPVGDERGLQAFLHGVTLVSLDEETARIFGRERGRLRAGGLLIGDSDLWMAATAVQYNLTLLTNNRRHFERIDGLRIESV
jgi:tRNA(fMet)-specific endonuclease VapC